jgi:uncharacterized protein
MQDAIARAERKSEIEIGGLSTHLSGMKCFKASWLIGLAGVMALAGCGQKPPTPVAAPATPVAAPTKTAGAPEPLVEVKGHKLPTHAQAKLRTIRLWLGTAEVSAEMALTGIQLETGMMFRTNMDENSGMIFPLGTPQPASFWMANCPLPLTAAYIDPQGRILEIHELHAYDTNAVLADSPNILYVLEMNQGWFARHHIEPGTTVVTERGTLQETFVRRNP